MNLKSVQLTSYNYSAFEFMCNWRISHH